MRLPPAYKYVRCRSMLRHPWVGLGTVFVREGRHAGETRWTMRCPHCTTRKIAYFDRFGRRVGAPQMRYPPDYKLAREVRPQASALATAEMLAWHRTHVKRSTA